MTDKIKNNRVALLFLTVICMFTGISHTARAQSEELWQEFPTEIERRGEPEAMPEASEQDQALFYSQTGPPAEGTETWPQPSSQSDQRLPGGAVPGDRQVDPGTGQDFYLQTGERRGWDADRSYEPQDSRSRITPGMLPPAQPAELSVAEKYFSETLRENKVPRGKVQRSLQELKQFGFEFFENTGRFEADASALVGPDYIVGPGDVLRIDIWGNIEGHYRAVIDRNGEIVLPKVGVINLWGQTFARAHATIENQIGNYFKHFKLNVSLDALRSINVFLVGEVQTPGSYQVSSLSSVLTTLSAAGGPTKTGSLRKVKVIRQGQEIAHIDFYDFFRRGDNSQDVRLQSGDTILVPVAESLVGVIGNVRRPAIYELIPGETLDDVLQMAGGVVSTAYLQKVRIERVEKHSRKMVMDVTLASGAEETAKALDIPLQDRDLVEIAPITEAGGYVKLSGFVARPGEYQLAEGMRLKDLLLPHGNLLPQFYPHAAQIIRRAPPEYQPEIITVNLQEALDGHPQHNQLLQEYDEVLLYSREDMEEVPEVMVSGAVLRPGTYQLLDNMRVKDLITVGGNLKRGAYLGEAEITRYTPQNMGTDVERFSIDLKKALSGHPQHNLVLQPEDQLVVRSIPDYGERMMVEVKGEVLFPGTYAISKGESLTSVLERAGGYTDNAYLRGAVFSREALKEVQRQQLQKLVAEEEQQINRVAQEIAAGAVSAEEAKSAQTLIENRKALVEKLKNIPVTGRLVVQMDEIEQLKGTPLDIILMGGDEIMVPENPQTVNVQGQVYNSTSLSWEPGKTAGYYLNKVGGTKANANTKEMFIVRADGTVVSQQQAGFGVSWDSDNWRWNLGGFNNIPIYPGDSILVPEQFKQTAWLRGIRDISTIIYQMALGAAAVASF